MRINRKFYILLAAIFGGLTLAAAATAAITSLPSWLPSGQEVSSTPTSSGTESETVSQPEILPPEPEYPARTFSFPNQMQALFLRYGVDYIGDENAIRQAELTAALAKGVEWGFNTVIISAFDPEGKPLFNSPLRGMAPEGANRIAEAAEAVKEAGLNLYILYPLPKTGTDEQMIGELSALLTDYPVDGVIFTDYLPSEEALTAAKAEGDSGMTALRGARHSLFSAVRELLLKEFPSVGMGLAANAFFASQAEVPGEGIPLTLTESDHSRGFDLLGTAKSGLLDFVFVSGLPSTENKATPFETVAKSWAALSEHTAVCFTYQQNRIGNDDGFMSPDQLVRQHLTAKELKGFRGCGVDSYLGMLQNYDSSADALVKTLASKTEDKYILSILRMSNPPKATFTTEESSLTFRGASDPNFPVYLNGERLQTDANGYISVRLELKYGLNTIAFKHKTKTVTYKITRTQTLIKEVYPSTSLTIDGGTIFNVSALGYKDAVITATVGGKTITLKMKEEQDTDEESSFRIFEGEFTAPAATSEEQKLGTVSYSATYADFKETKKGASVTINPKATYTSENAVIVTAEEAVVYSLYYTDKNGTQKPASVGEDGTQTYYMKRPQNFYLPKGTIAFISGNATKINGVSFYPIRSGGWLNAADFDWATSEEEERTASRLSDATFTADGIYEYLRLKTEWAIPIAAELSPLTFTTAHINDYDVTSYKPTKLTLTFHYAQADAQTLIPALSASGLFTKIEVAQKEDPMAVTLTLTLKNAGGFYGVRYYFEDGQIVFRFTRPLSVSKTENSFGYSLAGSVIVIDPGHSPCFCKTCQDYMGTTGMGYPVSSKHNSQKDPGALGSNDYFHEAQLNMRLAVMIKKRLEGIGATVKFLDVTNNPTAAKDRMPLIEAANGQIAISVHHNSGSYSAKGVSDFYYTPYSMTLCQSILDKVNAVYKDIYGSTFKPRNSGKTAFGRYMVTTSQELPSLIMEYGFVSNPTEYSHLVKDEVAEAFADATVKGIIEYALAQNWQPLLPPEDSSSSTPSGDSSNPSSDTTSSEATSSDVSSETSSEVPSEGSSSADSASTSTEV